MKVLDRFLVKGRGWVVVLDRLPGGIAKGVVLGALDGRAWRVDGIEMAMTNPPRPDGALILTPLPPTDGPPEIGEELG